MRKIKQTENAIPDLRMYLVLLMLIVIFFSADQAALIPNYLLVEKEFGVTHGQMGGGKFGFYHNWSNLNHSMGLLG